MTKSNINKLIDFINKSPVVYQAISNIESILRDNNFMKIENCHDIKCDTGNYYLVTNQGGIIAFKIPKDVKHLLMVASHADSPCLHIKNKAVIDNNNYLRLNVEPYGSMIKHSWFDRPLSIAGRIIYKENNKYISKLYDYEDDLLVIPSLCAHQAEYDSKGFKPNPQKEMLPIISTSDNKTITNIFDYYNGHQVIDYDLYVYNNDKAKLIGDNHLLLAPRIDNLACVFGTLLGFINSNKDNDTLKVYCCFNAEEIGSLTIDGADSTVLEDVLKIIAHKKDICLKTLLSKAFMVSADNGHAIHPNYPEFNDPTNICYLNKGIMIKHHINYTTNGLSSAIFKDILNNNKVLYQDFAARSDFRNGSTLGKIILNHVSVLSIDIGLPQLAMHSACETCGADDIDYLVEGIKSYFDSNIEF